jgi:hypothetical protein
LTWSVHDYPIKAALEIPSASDILLSAARLGSRFPNSMCPIDDLASKAASDSSSCVIFCITRYRLIFAQIVLSRFSFIVRTLHWVTHKSNFSLTGHRIDDTHSSDREDAWPFN